MRNVSVLLFGALLAACATNPGGGQSTEPDGGAVQPPPPPIVDATPGLWRHVTSAAISKLGAHHRGTDLIATTDADTQTLGGHVAYGPTDKSLEDEDVDVSVAIDGAWRVLGRVRTDGDGRFTLALTGDERLPAGIHDLMLSVVGDGTSAGFTAFVGPRGARVVLADVDGTLTASENAYPLSLVTHDSVDAQAGAAATLTAAAAHGATIVYVSTRGDRFTEDTRTWLATNGFPRGAMRLPRSIVTIPGEDTVEAKTQMIGDLTGFTLAAGLGNRATDIAAYTNAGIAADAIFVKLPEFASEVQADLDAGKAVGIDSYSQLTL